MFSLERYIIGKECELRLALTGTISRTTPVVKALRKMLLTGVIPATPQNVDPVALHESYLRILNTQRKADTVVPVCTRFYWNEQGEPAGECKTKNLRVVIDFATVKDDRACFFYVSTKKMGGTPPVSQAYSILGRALCTMFPDVREVYTRELLMLPLTHSVDGREKTICDIVAAPPAIVDVSDEAFREALDSVFTSMDKFSSRSDLRKCRVSTDPCPAYGVCQAG